jgi:hypothetical protein
MRENHMALNPEIITTGKKSASNNKIQHMSAHVYKTLNCPKHEDDTAKCQGCVPWSSTVMAQTLYVF